jgi:thioesterase domain-containing protein
VGEGLRLGRLRQARHEGSGVDPTELERYLHDHIPLSAAMGARVLEVDDTGVLLSAPLAPNVNHRDSVFGGSESALAILAAWSLVHVRLRALGVSARIVIQRNAMEYEAPILGEFTARSFLEEPEQWPAFLKALERRGRGRVRVGAHLSGEGGPAGSFTGQFVAVDTQAR